MKIAVIGYGKMGQAIERLAQAQGHEIVMKVNHTPNRTEILNARPQVAIEFTHPDVAYKNINSLLQNNLPVVSGTTGWLKDYNRIVEQVEFLNGSFIHSTNFSLGVNLFFEITQIAARLMREHSEYALKIEEIHHTQKKDAPSGTAISLAERIMLESNFKHWILGDTLKKDIIPIEAKRIENVPGTHKIMWNSAIDEIELKHTAHSRDGFALGAIKAAEFIHDKRGVFNMKNVLGL